MNMANQYLVIQHDDEYTDPVGIFSGNIYEILFKNFSYKLDDEQPNTTYSFHSLSELYNLAQRREHENFKMIQDNTMRKIRIPHINGLPMNSTANQDLFEKDYNEFVKKYSNEISVIVSGNNCTFKNIKKQIQKEISELSPETIEYIKANGI